MPRKPNTLRMAAMQIMWHALGMTKANYRNTVPWWLDNDNHRNHFATDGAGKDFASIKALVKLDLMQEGQPYEGGLRFFFVTSQGIRVAKALFAEMRIQARKVAERA